MDRQIENTLEDRVRKLNSVNLVSLCDMAECCRGSQQAAYLVFPTTFLQAPSDTQPQYGSLEAMHDLRATNTKGREPLAVQD